MRHHQSGSLTEELKAHFGTAAMNREARLNLNGAQWQQYRQMHDDFAREHKALSIAYTREYETRVEMARRRLIDQAGSKQLNLKHRSFGRDAFDASAITRQAGREVRFDHDARVKALAMREHEAKESFLGQCTHRQKMRGSASRAFENTVDLGMAPSILKQYRPQRTR